MTPFPYSVEVHATVRQARAMMEEHRIRHLPVKEGAELVGVVSQPDLQGAHDPDLPVGAVARSSAYVVDLNQPLDQVLLEMVKRHLYSALVVREGKLGLRCRDSSCSRPGTFLSRQPRRPRRVGPGLEPEGWRARPAPRARRT